MKVEMLTTRTGAPDHVTVSTYTAGFTYDLPDWLAYIYINDGSGRLLVAVAAVEPSEVQTAGPQENKEDTEPHPRRRGRRKA